MALSLFTCSFSFAQVEWEWSVALTHSFSCALDRDVQTTGVNVRPGLQIGGHLIKRYESGITLHGGLNLIFNRQEISKFTYENFDIRRQRKLSEEKGSLHSRELRIILPATFAFPMNKTGSIKLVTGIGLAFDVAKEYYSDYTLFRYYTVSNSGIKIHNPPLQSDRTREHGVSDIDLIAMAGARKLLYKAKRSDCYIDFRIASSIFEDRTDLRLRRCFMTLGLAWQYSNRTPTQPLNLSTL